MVPNIKMRSHPSNPIGRVRGSNDQRASRNTTKTPGTCGVMGAVPRTLSPRTTRWCEAVKATGRAVLFFQAVGGLHVNEAIERSRTISVRRPTPSPHDVAVVMT